MTTLPFVQCGREGWMMRYLLLGAIGFASIGNVHAQIYRCDGPQGLVFSQIPCAPQAETLDLQHGYKGDEVSRGHSESLSLEQERHWREREAEAERQREVRPPQAREVTEEDRTRWRNLAVSKRVAVGMPEDFVRRAWGDPDRINRSLRSSGSSEQWVYRRDRGRAQYVYLEGGVVTSIQD